MAVSKTGPRSIVVDGVEYRWKFPRRPSRFDWDYWGGCIATVQLPDCGGSVLPSQIADAIRRAVAAGWQADKPGPQFAVDGLVRTEPRAASDQPHE